jgi:hypothetical protein
VVLVEVGTTPGVVLVEVESRSGLVLAGSEGSLVGVWAGVGDLWASLQPLAQGTSLGCYCYSVG